MLRNMRTGLWRSLLALSLLFATSPAWSQGGQVGPANAILCGTYTASSVTTASATTLVSGVAGKGIYLCGYSASTQNVVSQVTFQLTATTSTPAPGCNSIPAGGASTAITPVHGILPQAPLVDHQNFATQMVSVVTATTSASNLCLVVGGTANLQFILYFSQF